MNNSTLRYATFLALGTAAISGVSNFINKIAVTGVTDAVIYTTLKNGLVAIFLCGLLLALDKWREIMTLTRRQILQLLAIGAVGGSVPFALFFIGLSQVPAINAALIHKTLFLWVALLAYPMLKERMTRIQWLGIGAIFAANLVVGGFQGFRYSIGELMILGATILWAVENIIAKTALEKLTPVTVAAARMTIGSFLLLGFIAISRGPAAVIPAFASADWDSTLIASMLLIGYVMTWYTALKHAPATYVATLLVPATLVTNLLSAIFITHAVSSSQMISAMLFALGIALVIIFARRTSRVTQLKGMTSGPNAATLS